MPTGQTRHETANRISFHEVDNNKSIEEIQKENPDCSLGKNHGMKTEKQLKIMERLRKKLENKKK